MPQGLRPLGRTNPEAVLGHRDGVAPLSGSRDYHRRLLDRVLEMSGRDLRFFFRGDSVAAVGLPVPFFEVYLKVIAREPYFPFPEAPIVPPPPPDVSPDLHAGNRRIDRDWIDLLDSLANRLGGRHLNEAQGARRFNPRGDQVKGVEDIRGLADPDRTPPLDAPDGCVD